MRTDSISVGMFSLIPALVNPERSGSVLLSCLNILITCFFVGIVEEFTFRGMLFGGLVSWLGRNRKSVILVAVISGTVFGFIHVSAQVFHGQITTGISAAQVIGKTVQTGGGSH